MRRKRPVVCKSRFVAAAITLKRQGRTSRQSPEREADRVAILASLPPVSRTEIEKCRTERGGYSFTKAWFLEHGLPYPPIAGWRQAVERDDDGDRDAAEETSAPTTETITALRNYDWLVRNRGLDRVALAWDTGTLIYGDGGALIEELSRPGFTPATGGEPDGPDEPDGRPVDEVPSW